MTLINLLKNLYQRQKPTLAQRVESVPMPPPGSYLKFQTGQRPVTVTPIPRSNVIPQKTGGITTTATMNLNPGTSGRLMVNETAISPTNSSRQQILEIVSTDPAVLRKLADERQV
jgi:hypothetical protein